MNPQLIIAVIIAAASFGTAWRIQDWRFNAKEKAHAEQKLAQVQLSAAASIRRADNVILAQNAARSRMVRLRRDLDGALSGLDRLRAQLASTVPGADATATSCADRARTVSELFAACAAELQDMAGKTDRHASDALMLQQAWPK